MVHVEGDLKCFIHNFGTNNLGKFNKHRQDNGCNKCVSFGQRYGVAWDRLSSDGTRNPYSQAIFVPLVGRLDNVRL